MKSPRRQVSRNVGMNPIAQAVARAQLRSCIVDYKIAVFLLQRGDKCRDLLDGAYSVLTVVLAACVLAKRNDAALSRLRGSVSACMGVMDSDYYAPLQTPSITTGLDLALELAATLTGAQINAAFQVTT